MGSKAGRIVFGLLAIAAALIFGLVPHTEHYQSLGFGTVDVDCGSVAHRRVQITALSGLFNDGGELSELPVFEGKTAAQVCDGSLSSAKTYTIVAALVGGIVLLVGLAIPGRRRTPARPTPQGDSFATPSPGSVSLPMPPPRAAPPGLVPFASKPVQNPQPAPSQVPSIPIGYPVSLSIPRSSAALPPPEPPQASASAQPDSVSERG